MLAGAVAVVAAVLIAVFATEGGGGTATTGPTTQPTNSQPTATERVQAATLAALLEQSNQARNVAVAAILDVGGCKEAPKDGIAQLQLSITTRVTVMANLKVDPAGAIPNGFRLVNALNQASTFSVEADRHYIDWMTNMQNAGTCPISATDPAFKAAAVSSAKATMAKQSFLALWNPVALQLNLTRYNDTDL